MTNVDNFTEKAKALIAFLKESFSQEELMELAKEFDSPDTLIPGVLDDTKVDGTLGYIAPADEVTDTINSPEAPINIDTQPVDTIAVNDPATIPFEEAPKFRIYWRAWKEGNSTSGQTESNLETAQMARAEAMTKLYDLGFTDLEILAIETIKNENSEIPQI